MAYKCFVKNRQIRDAPLDGGIGNDHLVGGAGRDAFSFGYWDITPGVVQYDTITGYDPAHDLIIDTLFGRTAKVMKL